MGFVPSDDKAESEREEGIGRMLSQHFRPEFLNRIDKVVVFNPLGKREIRLIIDKLLAGIRERLLQKGLVLHVPDEVYDFLLTHGYSEKYGAREMDRVIEPLAEKLLEDGLEPGEGIQLSVQSGRIVFSSEDEIKTQ